MSSLRLLGAFMTAGRPRPDALTPACSESVSGFAESEQCHILPRRCREAPAAVALHSSFSVRAALLEAGVVVTLRENKTVFRSCSSDHQRAPTDTRREQFLYASRHDATRAK